MTKRKRSRPAGTGTRRLPKAVLAGGSAMIMGGASLVVGPSVPAGATHGGTANSGILNTTNWVICAPGYAPPSRPAVGVNWGTAVWDAHPELSVVQVCGGFNVFVQSASYVETWFGNTTCPGGLDGARNCASKFVALNARTIDATPDPVTQWKKTACHEFGHVGGLNHQFTNNSCMTQGQAPPILAVPDTHDNDAIAATYPR